ncbi:hypothetical protein ASE26_11305 [Duganella sp. Root198D2]|nr:hypothetical protein ASD07_03875 [Duganella sp. Root336D2]KRB83743.1 hypothetical protein ASE26_11305 [Duganella sp. Root198D2]
MAGCGGGGGGATPAMPLPDPVPVASPGDTFTSALVALVRSSPENTEPVDIDGAALALPEGSEPVAVE